MKIKYFPDTDSLYIEFNDHRIANTQDLGPNATVDLDEQGKVVAMTIEHARESVSISEFSFQQSAIS